MPHRADDGGPNLKAWVEAARDLGTRELRQAVHTVLTAVAAAPRLQKRIVLKGGILLAIGYRGDRYTKDVDFSMRETLQEVREKEIVEELRGALALAVEQLDYGLDCAVQRWELRPADPDKHWQTLKISIGYAAKADANRHRRLVRGEASHKINVDISYNEVITAVEVFGLPDGGELQVSALSDVVAEKYRAMLQQPVRNRVRRQDVYDLYRLLERPEMREPAFRSRVLVALIEKSRARELDAAAESLADEAVLRRSQKEYAQLQAEIASDLPAFERAYAAVREYYEQLPWKR